MAESDTQAAWMKDWQSMQKQFTNAWTEAARQGGQAQGVPLHEGFEQWAKLFGGNESQSELTERVVQSAKQFVDFLQGAVGKVAGQKAGMEVPNWAEVAAQAMGGVNLAHNPVADALRSVTGEGAKGFEQMFQELSQQASPFKQAVGQMFSMPAFGYTRETQERYQKFAQANLEYREQLNRYNQQMLKASQLGLGRFESKLAERSEPGRALNNARELYDLLIDALEEGYAEVALSDEFRHVYGALVNAQMRVRQMSQQEVEHGTGSLGMPTRSELNAVHKKLAEYRRRIAQLEEAAGSTAAPVAAERAESPAAAPRRRAASKAAPKAAPARKPAARAKAPAAKPAATRPPSFADRLAKSRSTRRTTKGGR